jgi:hypothetical protein
VSHDLRTAAVLVPVYRDADDELRIVPSCGPMTAGNTAAARPSGKLMTAPTSATALRRPRRRSACSRTVEVVAELDASHGATGWRVHPFLGRIPPDTAWRLQETEIVGILTPAARALADPDSRAMLPFSSLRFREPLLVDGIDVEGHVLWGMTLRLLDDLLPRLLEGEWPV